ncbi:unnamed protein product [Schistosoma mattheei]|uniref:Uncharacterized protein n=1 Tax=Schistosoma mattheei TaxID=31246 RepID=A0A183Q1A1_9TREM|nr:unnamed protein product [Schistosoma mattheei]
MFEIIFISILYYNANYNNFSILFFSGEGSQKSGNSDERTPTAMMRAVTVHPETLRVMYFA